MSGYQRKVSEWQEFFAALYQLAGDLTLTECDDSLRTEAERDRMREVLLDALSQPEHYSAEGIAAKHKLAVSR